MGYIRYVSDDGDTECNKPISRIEYKRKLYLTISSDLLDVVRTIPKQAYILFKYIITYIDYDYNCIRLTTEDIKKILDTKHQAIASKAINDLISAKIVARYNGVDDKNLYCINHQEFFKSTFINNSNKDD